ncbi:MAG: hypothetical protein F4X26_00905, partial [Chloroflexi bacterium]|nr:hypothetical protein [Chloroflexota bacterium]
MIVLTEEMRTAVNNALDDGHPVISTSVGADGQPSLAFFGSTQVYSGDQLAVWVRNREGGFLQRIAANPHVAFLYRNPDFSQMWQFHGRGGGGGRPAGGGPPHPHPRPAGGAPRPARAGGGGG